MSLPNPKARLEFSYEELKLLDIHLDLDSAEGEDQKILEKLHAKIVTARAKLNPQKYKQGY